MDSDDPTTQGDYIGGLDSGYMVELMTWPSNILKLQDTNDHQNYSNSSIAMNSVVPNYRDANWHDLEVEFDGGYIEVSIDGVQYLSHTISNYNLNSGIIGLIGRTGMYHDEHYVDNFKFGCPENF